MDKSVVGLIGAVGAVGALAAAAPAQAATAPPLTVEAAMQAGSYADLLKPIPDALALLKAEAAAQAGTDATAPLSGSEGAVEDVQYYSYQPYSYPPPYSYPNPYRYHHHHHHHHHNYYRPRHHHHHHNHHHNYYRHY